MSEAVAPETATVDEKMARKTEMPLNWMLPNSARISDPSNVKVTM